MRLLTRSANDEAAGRTPGSATKRRFGAQRDPNTFFVSDVVEHDDRVDLRRVSLEVDGDLWTVSRGVLFDRVKRGTDLTGVVNELKSVVAAIEYYQKKCAATETEDGAVKKKSSAASRLMMCARTPPRPSPQKVHDKQKEEEEHVEKESHDETAADIVMEEEESNGAAAVTTIPPTPQHDDVVADAATPTPHVQEAPAVTGPQDGADNSDDDFAFTSDSENDAAAEQEQVDVLNVEAPQPIPAISQPDFSENAADITERLSAECRCSCNEIVVVPDTAAQTPVTFVPTPDNEDHADSVATNTENNDNAVPYVPQIESTRVADEEMLPSSPDTCKSYARDSVASSSLFSAAIAAIESSEQQKQQQRPTATTSVRLTQESYDCGEFDAERSASPDLDDVPTKDQHEESEVATSYAPRPVVLPDASLFDSENEDDEKKEPQSPLSVAGDNELVALDRDGENENTSEPTDSQQEMFEEQEVTQVGEPELFSAAETVEQDDGAALVSTPLDKTNDRNKINANTNDNASAAESRTPEFENSPICEEDEIDVILRRRRETGTATRSCDEVQPKSHGKVEVEEEEEELEYAPLPGYTPTAAATSHNKTTAVSRPAVVAPNPLLFDEDSEEEEDVGLVVIDGRPSGVPSVAGTIDDDSPLRIEKKKSKNNSKVDDDDEDDKTPSCAKKRSKKYIDDECEEDEDYEDGDSASSSCSGDDDDDEEEEEDEDGDDGGSSEEDDLFSSSNDEDSDDMMDSDDDDDDDEENDTPKPRRRPAASRTAQSKKNGE
eukprot:PhM_4_TR10909/c0_g1_i1/m.65174